MLNRKSVGVRVLVAGCQHVSLSPTPPLAGMEAENAQAHRHGDPKGGGAGVERCAGVTVYIYFSLCLSRFQRISVH